MTPSTVEETTAHGVRATVAGRRVVVGKEAFVASVMQAADEVPGLPRGLGLAVSGWMMRLGFLATPPLIGLVADAVGLRWAFAVPAALGVLAVVFAGLMAPAERSRVRD